MRTYKLAATALAATAAAIVNVRLLRSCRIRSVRWSVTVDAPSDNAALILELSSNSVAEINTNDSQNSIAEVRVLTNVSTSGGGGPTGINSQQFLDRPMAEGEYLYLHANIAGTVSANATVFVDVHEGR